MEEKGKINLTLENNIFLPFMANASSGNPFSKKDLAEM